MAKGDDADAQDAGAGVLLQPRRVLERRRAAQGARPAARRRSKARAARRGRQARLDRRASGRSSSRCCTAASASTTRACCRSIAGWSRTCSSRSCWPSCVCTETLAAGINLPARSVVLTSLVKGPFGKEKLIDPSTAHQIFGRAGRPQFDDRGLRLRPGPRGRRQHPALEGEVRPDPREHARTRACSRRRRRSRRRSRRAATRRSTGREAQFEQLKAAPPGKLYSKGPLPWRLLAYLLKVSPEVERVRSVIRKRLHGRARGSRPARSSWTGCC